MRDKVIGLEKPLRFGEMWLADRSENYRDRSLYGNPDVRRMFPSGVHPEAIRATLELDNLAIENLIRKESLTQKRNGGFNISPTTLYRLDEIDKLLNGISIPGLRRFHGLRTHKGFVLGSNLIMALESLFKMHHSTEEDEHGESVDQTQLDEGNREADDPGVGEPKRRKVVQGARNGGRRQVQRERNSTMRGPVEDFMAHRQRAKASKED